MSANRKVIGSFTLSMDGRTTGPNGPYDMSWIAPHNVSNQARDALVHMTEGTTALLGRVNYDGFSWYWPNVAKDESAEHRDRAFARWLNEVDKVVFSRTLTELSWENSRLAGAEPADAVRALRAQSGGDIWVLSSQSIIRQLLEADEIDRLTINLAPELVGGGDKLFRKGMPASSWSLVECTPTDSGAVRLHYDRKR